MTNPNYNTRSVLRVDYLEREDLSSKKFSSDYFAKFYSIIVISGGAFSLNSNSFNTTSVTDVSTGFARIRIDNPFINSNWIMDAGLSKGGTAGVVTSFYRAGNNSGKGPESANFYLTQNTTGSAIDAPFHPLGIGELL